MPKVSKVKTPGSRAKAPRPVEDDRTIFICSRCGKKYTKQRSNFPASQSQLYHGNNGYLTVCNHCMEELYEHYKDTLGSDKEAIHRICLKFDIYWNPALYAMLYKAYTSSSRVRAYISKTNLYAYVGKTYDDSLDEEYASSYGVLVRGNNDPKIMEIAGDEPGLADELKPLTPKMMEAWGPDFSYDFCVELDKRYEKWTKNLPRPIDSATQSLYRQICILEATIAKNAAAGKPIEQSINSLNNLLGSLNVKPVQKKQDDALDAVLENMTFGEGIKACEKTRPIPKPKPEYQDVDGIVRYITVWFLGHLCKMLHIKNSYCKMYEDEIAKLRVDRPELEDEEDEEVFNDIFGGEDYDDTDGDEDGQT